MEFLQNKYSMNTTINKIVDKNGWLSLLPHNLTFLGHFYLKKKSNSFAQKPNCSAGITLCISTTFTEKLPSSFYLNVTNNYRIQLSNEKSIFKEF